MESVSADVYYGRHRKFCPRCKSLLQINNLGNSTWFDCHTCERSLEIKEAMDEIKAPSHYQGKGMQVKDVIAAFDLGFNLGNVVKYVLRAGKKGNKSVDLKKAIEYLTFELEKEQ